MNAKKNEISAVIFFIFLMITVNSAFAELIHQWDFEGDAADSVGSADGTLAGNAAITTGDGGKFGEAVSLDGTGGTFVDVGGSLIPTTAFTLTAWVNQASQTEGERMTVAGSQTGGAQGAFIRIDAGTVVARTLPTTGSSLLEDTAAISLNTWKHVAFTYDSAEAKLYVDGVMVDSSVANSFTDYSNFKIGCQSWDSELFNFDGLIDDVRIYDAALSASEIAAVMGDPTMPTVDPGSDWITWSGEPVTLNDVVVTNNDPEAGELTLLWTADNPPSGVTVDITPNNVVDPTVTITKDPLTSDATVVPLTLTVTQPDKNPVASSMQIDVYDTACDAGKAVGSITLDSTDFNADCITDIQDLAMMAAAWLVNYQADGPIAK